MGSEKPREIAARVLQRRQGGDDYVENLLEEELSRAGLSPADRGLCLELVYGCVRWQRTLDELIARKTDGRKQKGGLQALLRLGLYQLFWLDRVPNHAAVHETVEAGRRLGFGPQTGFINAVLRAAAREEPVLRRWLAEWKESEPALGYSHPEWLWERWRDRMGTESAAKLLEWNNIPPPVFARMNSLKTDAGALSERLKGEGVTFERRRWPWTEDDELFELESHPPIATLPSFQEGLFYAQDPSTLLAVRELDPRPGETVLDLCSAPGGKTICMAQRMRNQGVIIAEDIEPARLALLRENCRRMGVTCVHATVSGVETDDGGSPRFDRILIDAPCSNTGVLRRRIDLRWRLRLAEIQRMARTQLGLLSAAAGRLKAGGLLVYSTCSIEPEENQEVVRAFLSENQAFNLASSRELLPFRDGVDGAYVAALRRGL